MFLSLMSAVAMTEAFAEEARVDITSFVLAGPNTRAAEICGRVSGSKTTPTFVRVAVDEKTGKPGIYNLIAGPDGAFCGMVVTYAGTAVASLWTGAGLLPQTSAAVLSPTYR